MSTLLDNHANQLNPNNIEYWRSRNLGTEIWALLQDDDKQDGFCNDWENSVRCASVGEDSYVCIDEDGRSWWWNIPDGFAEALRAKKKKHVKPSYVCLGPDSTNYFVSFDDGYCYWNGGEELSDLIEETDAAVSVLAFAPGDGYFALLDDGSWSYYNLPAGLDKFLTNNESRLSNVEHMSVSEAGWFVSFNDGEHPQMKYAFHTHGEIAGASSLQSTVDKLKANHDKLRSIDFGSPGNWLVRYDDAD